MSLAALAVRASEHRLSIFGMLESRPEDGIGTGTLALLGPAEPDFWAHVMAEPEFSDGLPDPMDRWSERVISELATRLGGQAVFPFGTPVRPFVSWALRSGRAWQSPVRLLVHDVAGLMVSYRGAVLMPDAAEAEEACTPPCETCAEKPCLTACPAGALTGAGYGLDACHTYLDTQEGRDCMTRGCAVRRTCPLSRKYGRSEKQSAFHMEHFHP